GNQSSSTDTPGIAESRIEGGARLKDRPIRATISVAAGPRMAWGSRSLPDHPFQRKVEGGQALIAADITHLFAASGARTTTVAPPHSTQVIPDTALANVPCQPWRAMRAAGRSWASAAQAAQRTCRA